MRGVRRGCVRLRGAIIGIDDEVRHSSIVLGFESCFPATRLRHDIILRAIWKSARETKLCVHSKMTFFPSLSFSLSLSLLPLSL